MRKISIILFEKNAAATIETTLRSLAAQTYKDFELVILDGGSTDGTLDIIARYDSIVNKLISRSDKGALDAVNKGLDQTTGEFILLLAADDWLAPEAVEKICAAAARMPLAQVIGIGQAIWEMQGGALVCAGMFCDPDDGVFGVENAVYGGGINRAFHRDLYKKHGLYRIEEWGPFADRDLQLRFAFDNPVKAVVPEPLYHFLRHEGSTTANGRPETAARSMRQSAMMALEHMENPILSALQKAQLRAWYAFCWVRAGFFLLRTGKIGKAFALLFDGLRRHPLACFRKIISPSMPEAYKLQKIERQP